MKGTYRYLTFDDRKRIEQLWRDGATPKEIAEKLGVHFTTVYAELKRGNNGRTYEDYRSVYDATLAQKVFKDKLKKRGRKQAVQLNTKFRRNV